ncbi:MAG: tRNA pseudouridine(13) synthase TruD [Candidatus Thermoplasmatota archaeon]|nr:tRNA pseudouridine(13) synthase TruD [Candidatus Thermoplasmatota archaeon]
MEEEVGIQGYLTKTPPVRGRLRVTPEDFIVEEVPKELPISDDGRFLLVKVTARNWETNRLVRELSKRLRISRRRISFSGTKDKRAVTTQTMSFWDVEAEAITRVRLKEVKLECQHRTTRGLKLGHLLGNRFRIRLRDVPLSREETSTRMGSIAREFRIAGGFPNFFGPQRFGERRPISHLVGRALVRGDLHEAVETYLAHPQPGEPEDAFHAREAYGESGDVAAALKDYPERLSFEKAILNQLRRRPRDYAGALKQLPRNLLTLFVYAYQALLFNRIVSLRLKMGLSLVEPLEGDLILPMNRTGIPRRDSSIVVTDANREKVGKQVKAGKAWISGLILGYEVHFAQGEMGRLERGVVEEEGVKPEDFAVRAMPRLSSRGLRREILATLRDFSYRVNGDLLLSFQLNPGCYATALLREITKGTSPY